MTQLEQLKTEDRGQTTEDRGLASEVNIQIAQSSVVSHRSSVLGHPVLSVAVLTGGGDKPYALGMAAALASAGVSVDFIGSDELSVPELLSNPRVNFLNLRGDQRQ